MRTPAQILSPFPDFFTFCLGPLGEGGWWEVAYIVNVIRYRTGNSSSVLPSREVLSTPDAADWALFWQTLGRIGVWDWCPDYTDPSIHDGQGWALEIRHADRNVKTGGTNAYPGSSRPPLLPRLTLRPVPRSLGGTTKSQFTTPWSRSDSSSSPSTLNSPCVTFPQSASIPFRISDFGFPAPPGCVHPCSWVVRNSPPFGLSNPSAINPQLLPGLSTLTSPSTLQSL